MEIDIKRYCVLFFPDISRFKEKKNKNNNKLIPRLDKMFTRHQTNPDDDEISDQKVIYSEKKKSPHLNVIKPIHS